MVSHRSQSEQHYQALAVVDDDNASVERLLAMKDATQSIASSMASMSEIAGSSLKIAECIRDCVAIRYEFKLLEKHLELNYAERREFMRANGPMIRQQLADLSRRIDTAMDRALAIETREATAEDLRLRADMLRRVDRWSEQLSLTLARLMAR